MKFKIAIICCSALLMSASAAQASALAQNTEEYRLKGNVDFNSEAGTKVELEVGYGYFNVDYYEVGVFGGFRDDDFITDFYIGGFGEYNFETGTELVPFLGVELSLHVADVTTPTEDTSATAIVMGFYVGTKYFISEAVAITGRLIFEGATDDIFIDEAEPTDSNIGLDIGLSVFF